MDDFASVMYAANEEAMNAGTGALGTAQLMLGILRQPDAEAAVILRAHGITEENYRAVYSLTLPPVRPTPKSGMNMMRVLPRAEAALEAVRDVPDPKRRVSKLARHLLTDGSVAEGLAQAAYSRAHPGSRRDLQQIVDALGD
jgi:Clp amino terminal domain, pathogenicity island component